MHDHLKDVAETLDRHVRESDHAPLVIVVAEETRAELEETLSHEVKNAVVGWTNADAHAGPAELLADVEPLLESRHAAQEAEVVENWKAEAGRNGRAASGWGPTLEAASDGRVELLLFQDGPTGRPGSAPRADASRARAAHVPSTARRWRSAKRGSTLPCTRPSLMEAPFWRCASVRISSPSRASARSCASEPRERRPQSGDCPRPLAETGTPLGSKASHFIHRKRVRAALMP